MVRFALGFVCLFTALCGHLAFASSEAVPIAPFIGALSEGFEAFSPGEIPGPYENIAGPVDILAGHASLSGIHSKDSVKPLFIWDSCCGFSLDDLTPTEGNVSAIPFDGTRALSLQTISNENPTARIDFRSPVTDFGGYWVHGVTNTMAGPITLTMLDSNGTTIDTVQFHYDYARLQGISQWFGWSSKKPIHALTFTGFWAGVDGIQINVIPEPETAVVGVAISLILLSTVRRRTARERSGKSSGGKRSRHKS